MSNQTYLAQVDKFRFKSGKLLLAAVKRPDGLWTTVVPPINAITIPLPSVYSNLYERELVLLELTPKLEIVSLKSALPELVRALKDWSLRLAKFDSEQSQIQAWKESLNYQAAQFFIREEELSRREDLVTQRERQAERVIKAVAENNLALERERTALAGAWEQVRNEKDAIAKVWQQIQQQETAIASAWERLRSKENA